jgi:hypothetical protein
MSIVSRILDLEFDTTDRYNVSDEDLLRVILRLDICMNANHFCLPDNILDTIVQHTLHVHLQELTLVQRVNVSVKCLEALIDIYLERSQHPYVILLQDVLTYIEDLTDMCI